MSLDNALHKTLNRLAKWRMVFVSWQLGTRVKGDPEAEAIRDHREVTILLRAEVSALVRVMVDKGVFTVDDFSSVLLEEASRLNKDYEKFFPGFKASDDGMIMTMPEAGETMKGWRP